MTASTEILKGAETENAGKDSQGDLAAWLGWLVLPRGYTDWLWRMCGICGLLDGLQVREWVVNGAVPYFVPAWRLGSHLLYLPAVPHWLLDPIFICYFLACTAIALGLRSKKVLLIPIATLSYFCCLDLIVGALHFTVLILWFLVSLLFDKPGLSLTRRLIQLCISFCYGFSVLQKLDIKPFRQGYSLAAHAHDGWFMQPYWYHVVQRSHLSHQFYADMAVAVILTEAFLCFALFPAATRKLAVLVGIFFHGIMAMLMFWWIGIFTLVSWTSYFAFLQPDKKQAVNLPAADGLESRLAKRHFILAHKRSVCAALALLTLWFCVPLRIYFWPGRSAKTITILDRRPWTFAMFVTDDVAASVLASYTDKSGHKHPVKAEGRMLIAQTDNDLYAMANYIFHTYRDASAVNVEANVLQNEFHMLRKSLSASMVGEAICYSPIETSVSDVKK